MIVLLGHSGCFVPVMRFRVAVPTVPVFSVYRGSLPLAFCFVPVMRFCVAVPTVPGFSVYPRQFAFGFLFRPGHAVLCCRTDGSGFFSLSAAVCLWLFVSSRSCGFVLPYRRFRVFQFIRGSLPLAFCFVPVMRFCVAVSTVPEFSVYPRQFAFGFLTVFFRLFFHLP